MIARWRKFMIGSGKSRAGFLGLLDTSTINATGVANVTTGETVLLTAKVAARALYKNNTGLYIAAFGKVAANANSKTFRVYLNTTAVAGGFKLFDSGALTPNNVGFLADVFVFRYGVKQQIAFGEIIVGAAVGAAPLTVTGTQDETVDQFVVLTGQSGTASGDITAQGLLVEPATL